MKEDIDLSVLFEIMSLKRPHQSAEERYVGDVILTRLTGLEVFKDKAGQPMAYTVTTDKKSRTLFSAHLDTVHSTAGHNPVLYDAEMEWAFKDDGTPLGADDAAGIFLMYKMVEAGVPGTYIFTVGEERGGVGAKFMADNHTDWLRQFNRAIAFDRKATHSVITHQWCGRCCSDEFAKSLSSQLTIAIGGGYVFAPDDGGVYTDTADYSDIIPECTNISAGYANEHTGNETLDVGYLKALLGAALTLDWEALPVARDPLAVDTRHDFDRYSGTAIQGRYLEFDDLHTMTSEEIHALCWDEPDAVAEMLEELLADRGEMAQVEETYFGKVWSRDEM